MKELVGDALSGMSQVFKEQGIQVVSHLPDRAAPVRADLDRVIQVLLGHKKLDTTALYSQVATKTIRKVTSPLERLTMTVPPPA